MSKKKKFLVTLLIIFILGLAGTITLGETYGGYHGEVAGTNFVLEEWVGAGSKRYDVDDEGNFYFLVQGGMFEKQSYAVVIYDQMGNYKYTLYSEASVATAITICSDDHHILIFDSKADKLIEFDEKGFFISKTEITDADIRKYDLNRVESTFSTTVRIRGKIRYENDYGTIKRIENGKEEVVFTIPTWQIWYKIINTIKYIALVGLFVFGFLIPVIRKKNGYE